MSNKPIIEIPFAFLSDTWVNWCQKLGTVLANDEVKDGRSERGGHPVEQKRMRQWSLRITAYAERLLQGLEQLDWSDSIKEMQRNWIGKSEGASIRFQVQNLEAQIEVFTTRPDTIFESTLCFSTRASVSRKHNNQGSKRRSKGLCTGCSPKI